MKSPRSRRERPSKPALTRAGIIDAALVILAEEGLGKVTMRRIAAALDTGPASLYVYVRDTADLHAQILDALLGRVDPPSGQGSWRDRIHEVLGSYAVVLFTYPEIARITMTTHPTGEHYFALIESLLELLSEGGVRDEVAAWGIDLLLASVTASAVEHGDAVAKGENGNSLAPLADAIAVAPQNSYPRIVGLGGEMLSGTGPERFRWGVDVLLNGLLHTTR